MTDLTIVETKPKVKATNCIDCGARLGGMFGRHDVGDGLCMPCDFKRDELARKPADDAAVIADAKERADLSAMIVTTETLPAGLVVERRFGLVSSDVAFGQHAFKDIAVGTRDLFGGRSAAMSNTLRDSRIIAINEMKREAYALGANAVIGVVVNITTVGHSSMTLVSATGTAVVIAESV